MNTTNEFSFILKPSAHGLGVFAAHDIKKGTKLRVFGENNPIRFLKTNEVPEQFQMFCVHYKDVLICPPDFGYMPIGWHLNHSDTANAIRDKDAAAGKDVADGKYGFWLAARDISEGEEITINYNALEEPEDTKEAYYHHQ